MSVDDSGKQIFSNSTDKDFTTLVLNKDGTMITTSKEFGKNNDVYRIRNGNQISFHKGITNYSAPDIIKLLDNNVLLIAYGDGSKQYYFIQN
jgi:hypothetical protein